MRADLNKDIDTLGLQSFDCLGKQNRQADVVPPVRCAQFAPIQQLAGDCRKKWDCGFARAQFGERLQHVEFDPVHGWTVKTIINIQPLEWDVVLPQRALKRGDCISGARHCNATATIDAGNDHYAAKVQFFNKRGCFLCIGEHSTHHAEAFGPALELAAVINDFHCSRQ